MKLGLGHSYNQVEFLPKKLRAYIDLTKPASSVGVGLAYFLASLFYFAYVGGGGWESIATEKAFSIVYVSITMFLAHSASQAMNMAEDAEMDRATPHKKNRPIPSGVVTEDEARTLAWILSAFALGRAYMVNWQFGIFATVLIFMGIFYNLEPIRAKAKWYSIPWQATSRGLFLFPAVWAAYGKPLSVEPWALGVFMFLYVLGFQNTADIIDRKIDEEYGIKTFVVMLGVEKTVKVAAGCLFLMVVWVPITVLLEALPETMYSLYLMIPFCLYMLYHLHENPYSVSETTGNHPAWLWFYIGLVLTVVIPLVSEIYYL